MHELAKSLGYSQVDLVGHDIVLMVAYAYAAQFPSEVRKLAPIDAPIPGIGDIWDKIFTTPSLWHFHFVESPIALDLVKGRERLMLEHVWLTNGGDLTKFPERDKQIYAKSYSQPGVMRDAFEYFRAFNRQDAEDNRQFAKTKLPMPVLVIEGDQSMNGALAAQARLIADNVKAVKFTNAGHWLMEERTEDTARELKEFLVEK